MNPTVPIARKGRVKGAASSAAFRKRRAATTTSAERGTTMALSHPARANHSTHSTSPKLRVAAIPPKVGLNATPFPFPFSVMLFAMS